MSLLKFPIKFQHEGETYTAFFRPTGESKYAKVQVRTFPQKVLVGELRIAFEEHENYQVAAQSALRAIKGGSHAPAPTAKPQVQKSADAPASKKDAPEPGSGDPLLPRVSSDPLRSRATVLARDLKPDEAYLPVREDGTVSRYYTRLESVNKKDVSILVLIPQGKGHSEWRRSIVPHGDKFVVYAGEDFLFPSEGRKKYLKDKGDNVPLALSHELPEPEAEPSSSAPKTSASTLTKPPTAKTPTSKADKGPKNLSSAFKLPTKSRPSTSKEATMPTATKEKKATTKTAEPVRGGNAPQSLGLKTNKTVFESWGIAFKRHGTASDAPKKIVAHMKEDFPKRDTQWQKWVNALRARYNSGSLPNTAKPKNPIPVYSDKRTGHDRRDK